MGPIETLFLVLIAFFGVVGLVRTWPRELGVTTMLLLVLFLLTFLFRTDAPGRLDAIFGRVGIAESQVVPLEGILAVLLLLAVAFISYQGMGLTYPGNAKSPGLSLAVGLINGYLLVGSIWYYLARANWPLTTVLPNYTNFYEFFVKLLPPAIFPWQFFILLAVAMLIIRVIK